MKAEHPGFDVEARVAALDDRRRELLRRKLRHSASASVRANAANAPDTRLVAYVQPRPGAEPDPGEIRTYLQQRLPDFMVPGAIVVLDALPLTPGGKLDRRRLPDPGESQESGGHVPAAARDDLERTLAGIWSQLLGVDEVGIHDDFFELGGDSIISIRIIAQARKAGIHFSAEQFFENPTIAGLTGVAGGDSLPEHGQQAQPGAAPLTPIQHWFFERVTVDPQHWNQCLLFEAPADLCPQRTGRAVDALIAHHDALRLGFELEGGHWHQVLAAHVPSQTVEIVDLSDLSREQAAAARHAAASRLHRSLHLDRPPLLRAAIFVHGDGVPRELLLIGHHLVVDPLSWRTLAEDLDTALVQIGRGDTVKLPPSTTPYSVWAGKLCEHVQSGVLEAEKKFWLAQRVEDLRLPLDDASQTANTHASIAHHTDLLDADETLALLERAHAAHNTRVLDLLLCALAQTVKAWCGTDSVMVGIEGHGRERLMGDTDLTRSVGWFTSFFPLRLHTGADPSPGARLMAVKELLRSVPNNGIGFGMLRYLEPGGPIADAFEVIPLSFNYMGQLAGEDAADTSALRPLSRDLGEARSPQGPRATTLEINAGIRDGILGVEWTYSTNLHQAQTISALSREYMSELRSLLRYCSQVTEAVPTPSDFPLAGLDQDDLDRLSKLLR